jgi:antitoxin MazE
MSEVTVGRWGKNLAVRVPTEIANASGLREGERVQLETRDGDIVIKRPAVRTRAAAEEIIRESQGYSLGEITIRELIEDGRRG